MSQRTLNFIFILCASIFVNSVQSESELTAEVFAASVNNFSCNFLKQVDFASENVVFSPLSISMAMGMVLKGAKGQTADEVFGLFDLNGYSNKSSIHTFLSDIYRAHKLIHNAKGPNYRNITIELANLILIAKNFNVEEAFTTAMKDEYFAAIGREDFDKDGTKIMEKINKFVKERTHELIPKVLDKPLKPDTVMFLLNTIYFKAYWAHLFDKSVTVKSRFHNHDKTQSTVDFLNEDLESYYHFIDNNLNLTVLEMDYLGNASMIFVLPHETYGLRRVMESVSCGEIELMLQNGKLSHIPVKIPKFKFEYETDLKQILPKMGVNSLFTHPDLSGIARNIKVSDAKHKALISVDEGGTEASAITTLRITPESLFVGPEFVADKPFIFFIRDKITRVNLFAGAVNKL